MKRIFTHACLIVGLLTAMMQLSCKKNFLDLRPPTSLPVEDALKTEADLMVALRGAYAGLRTIDLWGRTIPVVV
jgi:hypothetical protein